MLGAYRMQIIEWCDESIASFGICLNETRSGRNVAERRANSIDCFVQAAVEVDQCVASPDPGLQLFSGYQLPRPFEQRHEHLERLVLQSDFDAALPDLAGCEIDLEATETDWRLRDIGAGECGPAFAFFSRDYTGINRAARINLQDIVFF